MTPHKDINGRDIHIGSRAVFVGNDSAVRGRQIWVRATKPGRDRSIRVDDGDEKDTDVRMSGSWRWSAWVNPGDLSVIE